MNSEPKKSGALRRELDETNNLLLWLLKRIDEHNDDNESPLCPSGNEACRGNCRGCWYSAALDGVRNGQA